MRILPDKLENLHSAEEQLRFKALEAISNDPRLKLHLSIIESAMDAADMLRQFPTSDENVKVVQILGMRTFNAFGASLKLALSGYHQNSVLIMRDVLETVFLLNLFRGDRTHIERWRLADDKARENEYRPVMVRKALDERDGYTSKKRAAHYKMFSELAGHPTMKSHWLMRPEKNGDAVIGPFIETTTVEAVLSEMGRLAVQVGEQLNAFFPNDWERGVPVQFGFLQAREAWLKEFYPSSTKELPS